MNHAREHREISASRINVLTYLGLFLLLILISLYLKLSSSASPWEPIDFIRLSAFTAMLFLILCLCTSAKRRTWRFASKILKTDSSELRQQIEIAVADWLTEHADWEVLNDAESHGEEMRKVFPESRALGEWLHELEKRKEASQAKLEQYASVVNDGMRTLLTRGLRKNDFPEHWERHISRFE